MTTPDAGRPAAPAPPPGLPPYAAPAAPGAYAPAPVPYGAAPGPYAPTPGPYAPTPGPYAPAPGPYAPAPGGWGPPPPARGTDGLAIASLVLSCTAVATALLTAPVGLGLGIAALRRIRRTGADGRALAVGGVVVGAVLSVLLAVLGTAVVVAATTEDDRQASAVAEPGWPPSGEGLEGTTMPPFELTDALVPGDCLAAAPETYDMSDAEPVDCAVGHTTEVLEELAMDQPVLTDLTVPDATYTDLLDRCQAVAERLLDAATVQAAGWTDVYYPHPDQWAAGGRYAYCVLTTDALATGSARTGSFTPGTGALPGAEV